jgi:TldD protein
MKRTILLTPAFLLLSIITRGQSDPFLDVLKKELNREMEGFKGADLPPYFISYRVNETQYTQIDASLGSLIQSNSNKNRFLTCEVRVGDYALDNTHPIEDSRMDFERGAQDGVLPIDNAPEAIAYALWEATQAQYRQARSRYRSVKNPTLKVKAGQADFSKEAPATYYEPPLAPESFDKQLWENKLRAYSKPFQTNPDIVAGDVSLQIIDDRKYLVNSEGTSVVQNAHHIYLYISGSIRAKDGDIVPLSRSYFAYSLTDLPGDAVILAEVENVIKKLTELQKAPLAEPYTGPAILDAPAAGVFFHEIFGHRVEGHRLRDEMDGQTFKDKMGQRVLASTLSVTFDPTLTRYQNFSLNGHYRYDDEGVAGAKTNVVDRGILKTFLLSRTPMESMAKSNGHGRAAAGAEPVSRQSNLIIETAKPVANQDLRKMLIQECKKQNKAYGYFFKDVVGGFTNTNRVTPNAFNIFPTEVYRIYADGRPDELVRGVDLIGTPLAMFAEIEAAGNQPGLFVGFCGAESGNVPVSAVSPSLFVRRIETQKKAQTDIESTLLKSPSNH